MREGNTKTLQKNGVANLHHYSIAVIPGDGIGPEVMNEGLKALKAVEEVHGGLRFVCDFFDWNCDYYLRHGKMMPTNGIDILKTMTSYC